VFITVVVVVVIVTGFGAFVALPFAVVVNVVVGVSDVYCC
jgi:hypothetical protein